MLSFPGSLKVFVSVDPCDMRNPSECLIIPCEGGKPVESGASRIFGDL